MELTIILGLFDESPSSDQLLVFARVAEWIAKETRGKVLVIAPIQLEKAAEFDNINYCAHVQQPSEQQEKVTQREENKQKISPVIGQPHPYSPGEQLLATHLLLDEELADLFGFNMIVQSTLGNTFIVDLLWKAGKLIVEIDGYQFHSNLKSFANDRQRDFELVISNYLVLRIPHEEVMANVQEAVEKIRAFVRFRTQSLKHK